MVSGDRKITMAKKKKKGVTRDRAHDRDLAHAVRVHDTVSENTDAWDAWVQNTLAQSASVNNKIDVILKALADAMAAESKEKEFTTNKVYI